MGVGESGPYPNFEMDPIRAPDMESLVECLVPCTGNIGFADGLDLVEKPISWDIALPKSTLVGIAPNPIAEAVDLLVIVFKDNVEKTSERILLVNWVSKKLAKTLSRLYNFEIGGKICSSIWDRRQVDTPPSRLGFGLRWKVTAVAEAV